MAKKKQSAPRGAKLPYWNTKLKRFIGRKPQGGIGIISPQQAAWQQAEYLAQLQQTAPTTKKGLQALELAINQLEVAAQIDLGRERRYHYQATQKKRLETYVNISYTLAGEIPPPNETYEFVGHGRAWDGYAWWFLGPDGEQGAKDLIHLLAKAFGNVKVLKSWVDIGIGTEKSGMHLSTYLTNLTATGRELRQWRGRPSAQPIKEQEEEGDEVTFIVNVTAERGTPAEKKAKELLT